MTSHKVRTVLIVEDDASHRFLATRLLSKAGFAVLQAPDAETGLELTRARRPDLILMDVNLPRMSGLDATRLLKGEPSTRSIPVIVVSSYLGENPATIATAAGASAYVAKPYHHAEFLDTISRALGEPQR